MSYDKTEKARIRAARTIGMKAATQFELAASTTLQRPFRIFAATPADYLRFFGLWTVSEATSVPISLLFGLLHRRYVGRVKESSSGNVEINCPYRRMLSASALEWLLAETLKTYPEARQTKLRALRLQRLGGFNTDDPAKIRQSFRKNISAFQTTAKDLKAKAVRRPYRNNPWIDA